MRNAGDRASGGSAGRRHRPVAPDTPSRGSANGGSLFTPAYRVDRSGSAQESTSPRGQHAEFAERSGRPSPTGYPWAGEGDAGTGYRGNAGSGSAWPDDSAGALYSWADDDDAVADPWPGASLPGQQQAPKPSVSRTVRGFPPEPGDPPFVYPPGLFAAWNRSPTGDSGAGDSRTGTRRGDPTRQLAAATITPDEFDTDFSLPAIKDPIPGAASRTGSAGSRKASSSARSSSSATRRAPAPDRTGPAPGGPGRQSRSSSGATTGRKPATQADRHPARSGHRGSRAGHHSVRIAIAVAAAIVVAVAVVLVLTSHGNSPGGSSALNHHPSGKKSSPPTSQSPAPPWRYIAARASDPVKLTLQELYPKGFTSAGVAYRRSAAQKTADCQSSLIGGSIQTAVHHGGCNQALRATYFSRSARVMATIGVFNLKTYSGANAAARAANHSNFVAQLPANIGPTHQIGQGTGIEYAAIKGHYLVSVWAEFTDLRAPQTAAQRQRLNSFIGLLIQQTVNTSLSYRMANGKPQPPG